MGTFTSAAFGNVAGDLDTGFNPNLNSPVSSLAVQADGKVLVAGGSSGATRFASAELYNPATGVWSVTGSLVSTLAASMGSTAFLLPGAAWVPLIRRPPLIINRDMLAFLAR